MKHNRTFVPIIHNGVTTGYKLPEPMTTMDLRRLVGELSDKHSMAIDKIGNDVQELQDYLEKHDEYMTRNSHDYVVFKHLKEYNRLYRLYNFEHEVFKYPYEKVNDLLTNPPDVVLTLPDRLYMNIDLLEPTEDQRRRFSYQTLTRVRKYFVTEDPVELQFVTDHEMDRLRDILSDKVDANFVPLNENVTPTKRPRGVPVDWIMFVKPTFDIIRRVNKVKSLPPIVIPTVERNGGASVQCDIALRLHELFKNDPPKRRIKSFQLTLTAQELAKLDRYKHVAYKDHTRLNVLCAGIVKWSQNESLAIHVVVSRDET